MPEERPSRRERNKRRTRRAIAEAALALFERDGFEAVTVDQIVERADVSPRTFFRYFATKEDAAFPHWAERQAAFEARLAEAGRGGSPMAGVREALGAMTEPIEADPAAELRQQRVVDASPALRAKEAELFEAWGEAIGAHLRKGRSQRAARDAAVVAAAILGAVRASFRAWVRSDGKLRFARLEEEAFEALRVAFGD
ncbi:MAG TPA: TetR family transcriptional regulator [Polyangiaceae bacterium LLY-WYZ-15_(1-7)]|nr:TetR family transcriptional regulator [Polyangiaceae bacterium LLY-WYZ-15_(1-7)]HJL00914.1 TetR family transcriptional regulator [Polyangiaceae bacterium LLY-WYZ-15_(1-7)]HJL12960.1 TetR family transcriptional regulator [Polyangiaceae bacterium LLY-WYZ-15_(1-7)]HJL25430.1 TetR family transcriptional regulator [Polyangiaceae bacterium LLY-WYZ-15_(1-7)]HJL37866.1 TetR family transcriptional regulator [Polyangiaceae bacterium LLY-WYZ-15_(1-7)]